MTYKEEIKAKIDEIKSSKPKTIKEAFKEIDRALYPCTGIDCYERGNFHISCIQCPCYKRDIVIPSK